MKSFSSITNIWKKSLNWFAKGFNVLKTNLREGSVTEEKREASDEELDDEYLPACCRNKHPHHHPV
jgi:hypothetical protein